MNYIVLGVLLLIVVSYVMWLVGNSSRKSVVSAVPVKKAQPSIIGDPKSDGILESVSDGVVVIDHKGNISLFNKAAGLLAGWQQKDALNIDYHSVFTFCDEKGKPYSDDQNPFSLLLRDGKPHRDNNAALITKGSEKLISVSISVSPLLNREEQLIGAIGIMRDVSEEKLAERQRAEFISTASHEMRTPVAAIEGYLALAMNDKVAKVDLKARDYLKKAHESTQHLGNLFQDLLSSAKAEDGRLANHPQVIELGSYLANLSEDLRFVAEKKSLQVEYVVGISGANMKAQDEMGSNRVVQPLYNVYVDPERLREVITNLFDNSVKYSDHGQISIGLTGDNSVIQIYVKDTGVGIAPSDVPHLFQKFYRVDNTATRIVGGTGLGLFICRKIIEMYNGRIWVESEIGKGSTFFINLPRLTKEHANQLQGKSTTELITADGSTS